MTQPIPEPAPGAPAPTQPAPGAPTQPAPTPTPVQPGQDPNEPVDVNTLPANVQKLISDLRKENGTHRTSRTAAEQAAATAQAQRDGVLKALGLNPDGSTATSPEEAAAQLAERAQTAENAAWRAGVHLAVHNIAGKHGVDAARLLDSFAFADTLDDLTEADPESAEFRQALDAKVREFVEANPHFKATGGQGPARIGAEHAGGGNTGGRVQGLGAAVAAAYRRT